MQIDTKGNKVLIFSDPHQDIKNVKKIIRHEGADFNVCCGDWIDSHYYDSKEDAIETALYLKDWVFDPKNVTVKGNHDLPNFYINKYTNCSGYTVEKNNLINEIWGEQKWDIVNKFKWFLWVDDFLISHAGLNINHLHPKINPNNKQELTVWLISQMNQADICLKTGQLYWVYNAGVRRGGNQAYGGLTWQDWSEFEPIDGLKQICGHTHGRTVKTKTFQQYSKTEPKYPNYCIDTCLSEYITITNGIMEIKKIIDI